MKGTLRLASKSQRVANPDPAMRLTAGLETVAQTTPTTTAAGAEIGHRHRPEEGSEAPDLTRRVGVPPAQFFWCESRQKWAAPPYPPGARIVGTFVGTAGATETSLMKYQCNR